MSNKEVLKLLDSIKFPVNTTRGNVKQKESDTVLGMAVGVVQVRFKDFSRLSKYTRAHPDVVKILVDFAKKKIPNFKFTTIQINKNNMTALHVDRNNLGPSAMIGLGDYTGGEIWIADKGTKSCRNKFCFFDGNEPHGTMPFRGTRYTLVYFTQQRYPHMLEVDQPLLRCIGFPTPPFGKNAPKRKKYSSRKKRLDDVRDEFTRVVGKKLETTLPKPTKTPVRKTKRK